MCVSAHGRLKDFKCSVGESRASVAGSEKLFWGPTNSFTEKMLIKFQNEIYFKNSKWNIS